MNKKINAGGILDCLNWQWMTGFTRLNFACMGDEGWCFVFHLSCANMQYNKKRLLTQLSIANVVLTNRIYCARSLFEMRIVRFLQMQLLWLLQLIFSCWK